MRYAYCLLATSFALGVLIAAEPPIATKEICEKQMKEGKENMDKTAKDIEPFKKDKDFGADVVKYLAARAKAYEIRLKIEEINAHTKITAADIAQLGTLGKVLTARTTEIDKLGDSIKNHSAEKSERFFEAYGPYSAAQESIFFAQQELIKIKAAKK